MALLQSVCVIAGHITFVFFIYKEKIIFFINRLIFDYITLILVDFQVVTSSLENYF